MGFACRKYFRDALPLVGNPQSINLMKDLILEGALPESETNSWLDLIAFHPQPTKETLAAIMVNFHSVCHFFFLTSSLLKKLWNFFKSLPFFKLTY